MNLTALLREALEKGATDIILTAGAPPLFRIQGELVAVGPAMEPKAVAELVLSLMTERQQARFEELRELDFALSLPGAGRFRFNAFYSRGLPGMVARPVMTAPRSLEELGVPTAIQEFLGRRNGLIIVAGSAGSGKSTTLAAMVDYINARRAAHIITIEDPIEYVHTPKKGTVSQREVGTDAKTFGSALRSSLRQSPDVIVIGEVRDAETARTMLLAAETGHLVLASLHASTAPEVVERLLGLLPEDERQQARQSLAHSIHAALVQQLVPDALGRGQVLATELMIGTPAVKSLIREGKTHQLRHHMVGEGMVTMEESLVELCRRGAVLTEEALNRAPDKREFLWRLNGVRMG